MTFPVIEDGSGSIPNVPAIKVDDDGRISASLASTLLNVFRTIVHTLNGRLSLGTGITGHRAGNVDAQYIDFLTPAVANTEFIIPHGLGRLPVGYEVVRKSAAVTIYDSSVGSWSPELIYLKANQASITIKLLVW